MTTRHRVGSHATILILILVASTSFALLHWHKDSAHPGCQLCHVRHLPIVYTAIVGAFVGPIVSERDWVREDLVRESDVCARNGSGRSPPAATSFTL